MHAEENQTEDCRKDKVGHTRGIVPSQVLSKSHALSFLSADEFLVEHFFEAICLDASDVQNELFHESTDVVCEV